ncbi:uncharacterized protein [Temnothorax longispinosus]|uniref:uncharacterized protein n=1 Tax=Temnothorax longispinosus TaxID=300112 RepID=UPI003A9A03C1
MKEKTQEEGIIKPRTLIVVQHFAKKAKPETALSYEIRQFSSEPGIYFERPGQLQQVEAAWKLAIKIDVAALGNRYHQLQEVLQQAEKALETLWEKCHAINVSIHQTATAEERKTAPYFLEEQFYAAEDAYLEASDYLNDTVGKLSKSEPSTAEKGSYHSFRDAFAGESLQLPRITLPKFSGNFAEWENFRGIFESLVAVNESLSNTQKLHYLKASVTGDAALLINSIKVSDAKYQAAWQLLADEYDNQNAIIHSHIHAFTDLPKMKTENVIELKQLRDNVSASLAALTNLDRPVIYWDDLLVYLIAQKFSSKTRNEWNLIRGNSDAYPTYKEIHDFMTLRIRGLADYPAQSDLAANNPRANKARSSVNNVSAEKCVGCSGNHYLAKCDDFKGQSVEQRIQLARQYKCCLNCLRIGHFLKNCPSKGRCNRCRRNHHTLLHIEFDEGSKKQNPSAIASITEPSNPVALPAPSTPSTVASASVQTVHPSRGLTKPPPQVLLATAWIKLTTPEGRAFKLRALLDQGSTYSFISESLCQIMRTRRYRAGLKIHCFGEKFSGMAKSRVHLTLAPCSGQGPTFPFTGYVYQKITSYSASQTRPTELWPHLHDLKLADPEPSSRHPIHVLIGADLYGSLLLNDVRQGPFGTPTAQLTILGWIVSGPTGNASSDTESASVLNCVTCEETNSLLQRFWADESIPAQTPLTEEDERCERHFVETHSRNSQGRYIVRLPFKNGPPGNIGDTLQRAMLLYKKMESRLLQRPTIANQYHEFLAEYESMGHMKLASACEASLFPPVYIPHHFVLRESSSTTKLRVVFNASCKTSDGTSLNDHLMVGPNLQQDIAAIILRWRQFCYVYTADIAKMFRQILIHPDDANFQRIVWRPRNSLLILLYCLLTVTHGQVPSPFLAKRTLRQLGLDEGKAFPAALRILEEQTYVDDVLFGEDDIATLKETRAQLIALMKRGGFPLHKWSANSAELLQNIPADQCESSDPRIDGNAYVVSATSSTRWIRHTHYS